MACEAGGRLLVLEATRSKRNGIDHNGVVWRGVGPGEPYMPPLPEYSERDATRGYVYAKVKLA